jgi:hypothetical protein
MTFTANTALTAAQLNAQLRDNLLETLPGKATTTASHFVVDSTNSMVERITEWDRVSASESTTSVTYTDLTTIGPQVTVLTGNMALIFFSCRLENSSIGGQSCASFAVSGDTTRASLDLTSITIDGLAQANNQWSLGMWDLMTDLTPGANTFTMQYRCGGVGTSIAANRFIAVMPL